MKTIKIKFHGIDDFNQPIFKALDKKWYFGTNDILFSFDATEKEVLKQVNAEQLKFFGTHFNCEPMGTTPSHKLEIICGD